MSCQKQQNPNNFRKKQKIMNKSASHSAAQPFGSLQPQTRRIVSRMDSPLAHLIADKKRRLPKDYRLRLTACPVATEATRGTCTARRGRGSRRMRSCSGPPATRSKARCPPASATGTDTGELPPPGSAETTCESERSRSSHLPLVGLVVGLLAHMPDMLSQVTPVFRPDVEKDHLQKRHF